MYLHRLIFYTRKEVVNIFQRIKEAFINLWNKIFGNTIFGIYYDSPNMTSRKRKKRKKKKKVMASNKIQHEITFVEPEKDKGTDVLDVDLIDNNLPEKGKKKLRQYTKKIVDILIIMSCLWITWSYILSTIAVVRFQDVQVLSSLSEEVCRTILGVVIAYALKSFCESFAQASQSFKERKFDEELKRSDDCLIEEQSFNDEPVG